ncbi:unnamed protein product [Rhizophagus irregularis]|nr:unnamed protein product [Rhizophagus irregularis]
MTDFPSFTYHVKPLLSDLINNVTNFDEWVTMLKTKNFGTIILCLAFALWVWILSTITRNFSQVDRLWSILPVIFTWHFILHGCWKSSSISLPNESIFNSCGYKWESEDYRWSIVKYRIHWIIFEVLNIIFISLYQCFLLLAMTFPSYAVWYSAPTSSLNLWDLFASILFIGFLIGEIVSDNQQWRFQSEKYKLIAKANENLKRTAIFEGDYSFGFITRGLFRYSRHPNYFCEMGIWWSYYIFSIAAASF